MICSVKQHVINEWRQSVMLDLSAIIGRYNTLGEIGL